MDHEAAIREALDQQQVLGLTAWAEARGDHLQGHSSVEERIAVMLAIRNRTRRPRRFGVGFKAVCLAPKQFSCWNPDQIDANHQALMAVAELVATGQPTGDPILDETIWLAGGIIRGVVVDTILGSDHYYSPRSMPRGSAPAWAKDGGLLMTPRAMVGSQHFYLLP